MSAEIGTRRFCIGALAALAAALCALDARAQPTTETLDAQSRAIVDQLTLDRAAAVAALQRRADEREATLLAELGERDRVLRETLAGAAAARATRERAEADLAAVTAQRQAVISDIAARDARFAAEIAEYRRQIASIAASPDPRKREALARYAAGDRQGAMAALIDIQNAETAAVTAGWRDVAQRALDQYARGELPLQQAIEIVDRAARVADSDRALWQALSGLLAEAGRADEARHAASRAAALDAASAN